MRSSIRFAAVAALSTLPSITEAQGIRIGTRMPTVGLPTQAPRVGQAIRANQQYVLSRASFESAPVFAAFSASGPDAPPAWTSLGVGQHVDFRVAPFLALTGDGTQSMLGGPMQAMSLELGTRVGPRRSERGFVPYVDARYGYIMLSDASGQLYNDFGVGPTQQTSLSFRGGEGWGGAVGGGIEKAVTQRFSIGAGLTYARYTVRPFAYSWGELTDRYSLRSYRTTISLRFNNARYVPTN